MLFVLDESLAPVVAEALSLVGYDICVLSKETDDYDVIEYCRMNNAVWVHVDGAAYGKHRTQLIASQIKTIFINRPRSGMSGREQLRVISSAIPKFIEAQSGRPRHRHYEVKAETETSTVRLHRINL